MYDKQIGELRTGVGDLKSELCGFRAEMAPAREVWEALAGLAKVLKWIGVAAMWLGKIGAAVGIIFGIYTTFTGGGK